jgi:hypothetical protein
MTVTTTVTVNGKKYNLEQVLNQAIEKANNGYVCPPDLRTAATTANPEQAARIITIARYVGQIIGWTPRWDKLNPDDLLGSLTAAVAGRNKKAGKNAMVSKYGHDLAQKIISEKAGRHISLK